MTPPNDKRKILFINGDSSVGTRAQASLLHLIKDLNESRYQPVISLHRDGPFISQVESLGCEVYQLQNRLRFAKLERLPLQRIGERLNWLLWKRTRGEKIIRLIRDKKIDLVHTNSINCFEGAYAAFKTKRLHVWHIRELLPGNRKVIGKSDTRRTLKMISRYSDKVVCVSDAVKRQFTGWQRHPDKYITIYDGIDTELFNPKTAQISGVGVRDRFEIPDNVPLLCYSNPISPHKGLTELIEACKHLKKEGLPFKLMVIGEPFAYRFFKQVKATVTDAGLERHVHFLGRQSPEKLPGYLKQMNIFVSPAQNEPFAYNILEAMAMGLPVVGVNSGSNPELITHNKTGLLAKTNIPSLAQAIITLIEDRQLRESYGQAGQEKVLARFTLEHTLGQIHALYEEMLGR